MKVCCECGKPVKKDKYGYLCDCQYGNPKYVNVFNGLTIRDKLRRCIK